MISIYDCNDCDNCSPKENKQTTNKEAHICKVYGVRLYHRGQHPRIVPCDECPYKMTEEQIERLRELRQRLMGVAK